MALVTTVLQNDIIEQEPRFVATHRLDLYDPQDSVLLPGAVSLKGVPKDAGCARKWAHDRGGLDVGSSRIELAATGAKDRTVAIRNIRAERVGPVRKAPTGTILVCTSQGEGQKVPIGIDVSSSSPTALRGDDLGAVSYEPYFKEKYTYLENQKPESYAIIAMARPGHVYDYVIKVDGSVDGEPRTWTVKNGDQPFRISGAPLGRTARFYAYPGEWTYDISASSLQPGRCSADCQYGSEAGNGNETGDPVNPPPQDLGPTPDAIIPVPEKPNLASPGFSVDHTDPYSVASAWAIVAYSHDTETDVGTHDSSVRAAVYLKKELAQAARLAEPRNTYNAQWIHWEKHRAWTYVTPFAADVKPFEGKDKVAVSINVHGDAFGDDGWQQEGAFKMSWKLMMERQPDGVYRIADFQIFSEDAELN